MERAIFHCDCNSFYASVEERYNPALRKVPMAVTWSGGSRRGVILAKNELAKSFGIQTAQPVAQALRRCPQLVLTQARHGLYQDFSRRINAIYESYTDRVERFGIDESYLDVTGSLHLFGGDAPALAHRIRRQVEREVGLTISVGASFNKTFAKIGSDYKKPNAVTVISRENFREVVWPLPASAMLYVGKVTAAALLEMGISTIGDLARADRDRLARRLGKAGEQLYRNANGEDRDPVLAAGEGQEASSVGNSSTFEHNLTGWEEIGAAVASLADTVAFRLRRSGVKCATVHVAIRDADFRTITRQKGVEPPTWLSSEIGEAALELIRAAWPAGKPIRMLAVSGARLTPADAGEQLSLFDSGERGARRQKREKLEQAMDDIRNKFGGGSIGIASAAGGPPDQGEAERKRGEGMEPPETTGG